MTDNTELTGPDEAKLLAKLGDESTRELDREIARHELERLLPNDRIAATDRLVAATVRASNSQWWQSAAMLAATVMLLFATVALATVAYWEYQSNPASKVPYRVASLNTLIAAVRANVDECIEEAQRIDTESECDSMQHQLQLLTVRFALAKAELEGLPAELIRVLTAQALDAAAIGRAVSAEQERLDQLQG